MRKSITLSLLTLSILNAADIQLETIGVESTLLTEVAQKAQTSADVAQALSTTVPSIDMSRRSGIANDILIRGQKRDNITVEVDGTKVYGACPNRMDPPVSHILANQIETIKVIEGPYDVETFGTLSGGIKIQTKQPTKDAKGQINVGFGSFNYKKFGATGSGGNDFIRMSITASMESSDQYKDGNGDTIADQIDNYADLTGNNNVRLKPEYYDMPAYSKKSILAKAFITTAENQELQLSVTANRSNNILYGNSKMDAMYDDSNIYNVAYNINSISNLISNINLQYFHSDVDHPMATKFRVASDVTMMGNKPMDNTNHLKTTMDGLKLKSTLDISSYKLLLGLDTSERTWDGRYYNTTTGGPVQMSGASTKSIDDATTKNGALFAKLDKVYTSFSFSVGLRYDMTTISHATLDNNDYNSFGANLVTNYHINSEHKLFLALGQASRVPDARELYFTGVKNNFVGTPDLDQTTNQEIDLGYETDNEYFRLKIKAFYSQLSDYIYYQKDLIKNNFQNIDATVYGTELSASIYATDDMTIDMGVSYKVGSKKQALEGQTDKDLADIAPLRGSVAVNYEYMNNSLATLEGVASDRWNDFDADNGEQELAGWAIVNAKVKHAINKKFDFTLGVNNLFDTTYAVSNTYADLTLITSGGADVMLINEPGRYIYTNLDFKF